MKKTNQTDSLGEILLSLLWILVIIQIGCGFFGDTSYVAPWTMVAYAVCAIIGIIKLRKGKGVIGSILGFLCIEAIQIVPYLVILAVKGLL